MRIANRWWQASMAAAALFVLTAPTPAALGANDRQTVQIFDLLPPTYDRARVEAELSSRATRDMTLAPLPTSLLADLRWAYPDPAQRACGLARSRAQEALEAPAENETPPSQLIETLLDKVHRQVLLVEYGTALKTLEMARDLIPCLEAPIKPETVGKLIEYEAVVYLFMKDPKAKQAFADLAAVTTTPQTDPSYPPAVTEALMHAFKSSLKTPRIQVDKQGILDSVMLDGIPVERVPDLLPGRHIIQFLDSRGSVRSRLVTMGAEQKTFSPASVDVGLMSCDEVRTTLSRAMLQNTLSAFQVAALQHYMKSTSTQELIVAVEGASDEPTTFLSYRPETGSEPWTPPSKHWKQRNMTVTLAINSQFLRGSDNTFAANGAALGYSLEATLPLGRLTGIGDISVYPHLLNQGASEMCGTYDGSAPPTDAEIQEEASCLPGKPSAALAVGAGMRIPISSHIRVTPALMARLVYLPNTLVPGSGETTDAILVTTAVLPGTQARARLVWQLMQDPLSLIMALDVHAGALLGRAGDTTVKAFSAGVAGQVGILF